MVASASLPGAEMSTLRAPALRCSAASSRERNRPGRLDDDVDVVPGPVQQGGVPLGGHGDPRAVDHDGPVLGGDLDVEPAEGRVERQQVGQRRGVGQVVDARPPRRLGSRAMRRKLRPTRPNPLIPTRTVMAASPIVSTRCRASHSGAALAYTRISPATVGESVPNVPNRPWHLALSLSVEALEARGGGRRPTCSRCAFTVEADRAW